MRAMVLSKLGEPLTLQTLPDPPGCFTGFGFAADLLYVTDSDPTAKALGYVEDASATKSPLYKVGSNCANCQLYSGPADGFGPCQWFPGKAEPDQLDIAPRLALQTSTGLHAIKVAVDVNLEHGTGVIRRTSGGRRKYAIEARLAQVQFVDEHIDDPNQNLFVDVVVQPRWKQDTLRAIGTLDKSLPVTPQRRDKTMMSNQCCGVFSHSLGKEQTLAWTEIGPDSADAMWAGVYRTSSSPVFYF